jgi:hypothetical protein
MVRLLSPEAAEIVFDEQAGSWFESYGRFASNLLVLEKTSEPLPKLVAIQAPSRSFVASALNIGFSAQAIFALADQETRIPLESISGLESGSLLQVRFQWQHDDKKSVTKSRRIVTGTLVSFLPVKAGARFPSITLDLGSKLEKISLTNNLAKVFAMPPETPKGQETQEAPADGINLERWGSFFSQQRPTACTFTYLTQFEQEASLEIKDHLLVDQYLLVPSMNIKKLSRLDRLTEDQYTHFVNAFETLKSFQKLEDEISPLIEPFQFVILDGNAAVANLVGNSLLRHKTKICIIDSGNHERLSDSISAIGGEAMHLERPQNDSGILEIDSNSGLFAEMWF